MAKAGSFTRPWAIAKMFGPIRSFRKFFSEALPGQYATSTLTSNPTSTKSHLWLTNCRHSQFQPPRRTANPGKPANQSDIEHRLFRGRNTPIGIGFKNLPTWRIGSAD